MAGWNFAGSDEHDEFLLFKHFFKVVWPETIRNKKLNFGMNFGDNLTPAVRLKVPDGRVWFVHLTKHRRNRNRVWLDTGLADFLSFYSIAAGHMLFFKYNGDSDFHVVICDTCAYEVTYPSVEESHSDGSESDTDDDEDGEEEDSGSDYTDDDEDGEEEDSDQGNEGEGERLWLRLRPAASSIVTSTRFWWRFNELSVRSKEAVKRAVDDRSNPENPMVHVVLSKYHVTDSMYLPSVFSNRYFPRDVATVTVALRAHEKNSEFVGEWEMHAKITDRFIIQQEWIAFYHGNGYAEGDVCLFSLIKETRKIFNVHIFRAG